MRVLFVCTGNTCRSPMAEALTRLLLPDWEASSRGLSVSGSLPAAREARAVMAERGCDLEGHLSRPVTPQDLAWADRVYGVTENHAAILKRDYPEYAEKIRALPGPDIGDPLGSGLDAYRRCADGLTAAIRTL